QSFDSGPDPAADPGSHPGRTIVARPADPPAIGMARDCPRSHDCPVRWGSQRSDSTAGRSGARRAGHRVSVRPPLCVRGAGWLATTPLGLGRIGPRTPRRVVGLAEIRVLAGLLIGVVRLAIRVVSTGVHPSPTGVVAPILLGARLLAATLSRVVILRTGLP